MTENQQIATQERPQGRMAVIKDKLNTIKPGILQLNPDASLVEQGLRSASFAVSKNLELQKCSVMSIAIAVTEAIESRLYKFSGSLAQCYLVPYKGECKLIFSRRGLCDLALRNDKLVSINAAIIYANDGFSFDQGTGILTHPYNLSPKGEMIGAWAGAKFSGGHTQYEVMSKAEIDAIRSKAQTRKVWDEFYHEMAKKTVIRRLCKYLPLTQEAEEALERADANEFAIIDSEPEGEQQLGAANLKAKLAAKKGRPAAAVTQGTPEVDPNDVPPLEEPI